jgi:FkbM family methyltransferase
MGVNIIYIFVFKDINLKKQLRKKISSILPSGKLKDILKSKYYNFFSPNNINFQLNSYDKTYITNIDSLKLKTTIPLYHTYEDLKNYIKFYKIKNNDTILDLGANFGLTTLFFASFLSDNGKVYALEPDAKNSQQLLHQMKLNPCIAKNVFLDNALIWSTSKRIIFNEDAGVASSVIYKSEKSRSVIRKSISLDDWVIKQKIDRVNFIKMDIEGAEIEAIKGAQNIIQKHQPNFAIASYHKLDGKPTYIELEKLFEQYNYPYRTEFLNKGEIITYAGSCVLN